MKNEITINGKTISISEESFNEIQKALAPYFVRGQWYKTDDPDAFTVCMYDGDGLGYGLGIGGTPASGVRMTNEEFWTPASVEFVRKCLGKYAVKEYAGKRILIMKGSEKGVVSHEPLGSQIIFRPEENHLLLSNGDSNYTVFYGGKWAEKAKVMKESDYQSESIEIMESLGCYPFEIIDTRSIGTDSAANNEMTEGMGRVAKALDVYGYFSFGYDEYYAIMWEKHSNRSWEEVYDELKKL